MLGRPPLLTREVAQEYVSFYEEKVAQGLGIENIASMLAIKYNISASAARQRLWKARKMLLEASQPQAHVVPPVPEEPADPVEVRRYKQKAEEAQKKLRELEKRLVKAEDIRGELLGLGPMRVAEIAPDTSEGNGRRAVILHISDIQYGEYINPKAMRGLNSYNIEIANARIQRFFKKAHRFVTELWQGEPPEEIIVLLNGDLVSGSIHPELAKTDVVGPLQQALLVAGQLSGGIKLLADEGYMIRVIATPGNHGRITVKPESKEHASDNLDIIAAQFMEQRFLDHELVSFQYSEDVDAEFSVFRFPMVVTHGDRIGARGGTGYAGAMVNIVKGHAKVFSDYEGEGKIIYKVFTGHFHTPGVTTQGYANGTMAGPSEYSRDLRLKMTPPQQDYFVIHETHGIIEHRVILVGDISEGTMCSPVEKFSR